MQDGEVRFWIERKGAKTQRRQFDPQIAQIKNKPLESCAFRVFAPSRLSASSDTRTRREAVHG
jgi:hypothetical protein